MKAARVLPATCIALVTACSPGPPMKLYYYADTDSLYIDLADRPSVTSQEVRPGIVLDLDDQGDLVGIDIDHASSRLELPIAGSGSIPFESVSGSAR